MRVKQKDYIRYTKDIMEKGWSYDPSSGHVVDKNGKQKSYIGKNGYYRMYEWAGAKRGDRDGNWYLEHRVIWIMHYGEISDDLVINHIDSDRGNNHIENLELVTQNENMEHASSVGRMKDNSHRKGNPMVGEREVKAMRFLHEHGWGYKELGELFAPESKAPWNIAYNAVHGIRHGWIDDARSIAEVYPAIVLATRNNNLSREEELSNSLMGIAGEGGEIVDLMKKHLYQGHDFDEMKLMEETGDLLYYVVDLCVILYGLDMTEVMLMNMDKLINRYPEGFSAEKSLHRKEGDI